MFLDAAVPTLPGSSDFSLNLIAVICVAAVVAALTAFVIVKIVRKKKRMNEDSGKENGSEER